MDTVVRITLLLLLLSAAGARSSRGQEVQVAFDEAGEIQVVGAELEDRLGLFPDYDDFVEARLYRMPGAEEYELVIQYRQGGRTLRDRRALTEGEVRDLRGRVRAGLASAGEQAGLDQEGRYKLLAATTLLGAEVGALLPAALSVDSDRIAASVPLFGAAGGFAVPFLLTRNKSVTEAQATMTLYGGLQGNVHGLLLALLASGNDLPEEGTAGAVALMSAGQAAAGYALTDDWGLSAGTAEMMGFGSFFGTGLGAAVGALTVGSGFDEGNIRFAAGTSLAGSVAGSYAGYSLAQTERFTQGDARLMARLGGFGTQVATNLLVLLDDVSVRAGAATLLSSSLAGLGAGRLMVRGRDFSRSQANIIWLGSLAGTLLGSAVAIAADSSPNAALTLSTVGAGAGIALTYSLYQQEAKQSPAGPSVGVKQDAAGGNWQFQLHPAGALTRLLSDRSARRMRPALFTLRGVF